MPTIDANATMRVIQARSTRTAGRRIDRQHHDEQLADEEQQAGQMARPQELGADLTANTTNQALIAARPAKSDSALADARGAAASSSRETAWRTATGRRQDSHSSLRGCGRRSRLAGRS